MYRTLPCRDSGEKLQLQNGQEINHKVWNEGKNQHKPGQPFQVDLHTGPESWYIPWSKHKNFRKTSCSMGHFNINEDKYNWSSLLGKRNARDRARRISQIVPKKNGPCLTKTLRWKIAKLRMRTEMEEQFYTTLFHFIVIIQISTTEARSPICAERSTFLVNIIVRANFVFITRKEGGA